MRPTARAGLPAHGAVIAIIACVSCDSRVSTSGSSIEYDSAGIRIIESMEPAWGHGDAWRVAAEPAVDIGASDSLYRIGNVIRLGDGRIVLAQNSTNQVLTYSPSGQLVKAFGRRGRGPGEFEEISRLRVMRGDSLLAVDLPLLRVSVFDSAGRLARTHALPKLPDGTLAFVDDVFEDGSLLLIAPQYPDLDARGLVREQRPLERLNTAGDSLIRLVHLAGTEMYYQDTPFGVHYRRPWFGHTDYYRVAGDRLYAMNSESYQIREYSVDGSLTRIWRRRYGQTAVSDKHVSMLIDDELERASADARPALARVLTSLPSSGNGLMPVAGWPTWSAAYGRPMEVDDDGNVWLVDYFTPGDVRNSRTVFSPDGRWLGTVVLPERFAPTHIGHDFIVGRWLDSLDIEHVRVYELIKPGK